MKIKRIILLVLIAVTICMHLCVAEASGYSGQIYFNRKPVEMSVRPIVEADRVFIPLRAIFQDILGYEVNWISNDQPITISELGMRLQINNPILTVNEKEYILDTPPRLSEHANTMIPLRQPLEAVGYSVLYDDETSDIFISNGNIPWASMGGFRKTTTQSDVKSIRVRVTMPEVTGLGEKLAANSKQGGSDEAAYVYFNAKNGKDDIEFGYLKNAADHTWKLFISYWIDEHIDLTIDSISQNDCYSFYGGRIGKLSDHKLWINFSPETWLSDGETADFILTKDEDGISFSVQSAHEIKFEISIPFANAKQEGGDHVKLGMVTSYLVNTYDNLYRGIMWVSIPSMRCNLDSAGSDYIPWIDDWEWVEDNGNTQPDNADVQIFDNGESALIQFGTK